MFPVPKLPKGIPKSNYTLLSNNGSYDPTTGLWINNVTATEEFEAVILPYSENRGDKIQYEAGAVVEEKIKLYADEFPFKWNEIIVFNNKKYKIIEIKDYVGLPQTNYTEAIGVRLEEVTN